MATLEELTTYATAETDMQNFKNKAVNNERLESFLMLIMTI